MTTETQPMQPSRLYLHHTLSRDIRACTDCGLCGTRTQAVPGVGNLYAKIAVVGEAPGENEDREGEPFVGRSGHLLDSWLREAGLNRGDVYILNTVQCRPPGNRDPHPSEASACSKWLEAQLQLIQPAVILAVGKHAANAVTSNRSFDRTMGKLRAGNPWDCSVAGVSARVVCVYHPSYVLRCGLGEPNKLAIEDVKLAVSLTSSPGALPPRIQQALDLDEAYHLDDSPRAQARALVMGDRTPLPHT